MNWELGSFSWTQLSVVERNAADMLDPPINIKRLRILKGSAEQN